MLTQSEVDRLLQLLKVLVDKAPIQFPIVGEASQLQATSEDGKESFLLDINRRGRIKVTKCTYQKRYQVVEILLRLDVDGPPHENPDGVEVPCPHLHIYKEGFADKWAYPLPAGSFTNSTDLVEKLIEFLRYCKVRDIPQVQRGTS